MRIGQAAKILEISPAWLRRLERAGRIPQIGRDFNGHRRLSAEDVERLREILYPQTDAALSARGELR